MFGLTNRWTHLKLYESFTLRQYFLKKKRSQFAEGSVFKFRMNSVKSEYKAITIF